MNPVLSLFSIPLILALATWLGGCEHSTTSPGQQQQEAAFKPDIELEESLRRHRSVVQDDIWWTMTGEQMAWANKNLHQLVPTVNVYRAGPVRVLAHQPMPAIAAFSVQTPAGDMPFEAFLHDDQSTALGVVILHKGKIVFESYPRMQDYQKPIYWSVAKAFPATLIGILEERGEIDVSRPIEAYLPELGDSAFAGISVRNILDMATGLDCEDEYENRASCYYQYSMAIGDGYRDEDAADDPYAFVATLKVSKHAQPGEKFSYSGVNTFVLAWLVEKVTGYPFHDVLSKEIWSQLGAEADASYIAYRYGIPLTHGGFLARPRDLARFGLLFTPSYKLVSERRIISEAHINLLRFGANPTLRRFFGAVQNEHSPSAEGKNGPPTIHSIYQWDFVHADGTLFKGGWGGQGLVINPERDLVAVYASYFKDDYSEVNLGEKVFATLNGVFGVASPFQ